MENGLSASDVALMSRNNGGYGFDGGYGGMFGLLVLLGIMNGGFGGFGNNGRDYATTQDVNNAQQFGQLLDGNRDIMSQANNNTNSILSAINAAEYEGIAVTKDAQLQLQDRLSDLHAGQRDIVANQNQCCCNTRLEIANQSAGINQNIMQNRYESALNTDKITNAILLDGQKTRELIVGNRFADMQNRINQLELSQAMNGVLRFPNQWTYGAGAFPPIPFPQPVAA